MKFCQVTLTDSEPIETRASAIIAPYPRAKKLMQLYPDLSAWVYLIYWVSYKGKSFVPGRGGSFVQYNDNDIGYLSVPHASGTHQVWADYGDPDLFTAQLNEANRVFMKDGIDFNRIHGFMIDEFQRLLYQYPITKYGLSPYQRVAAVAAALSGYAQKSMDIKASRIAMNLFECGSAAHSGVLPFLDSLVIEGFYYQYYSGSKLSQSIRDWQNNAVQYMSDYKADHPHVLIIPNLPKSAARNELMQTVKQVYAALPKLQIGYYYSDTSQTNMPTRWDWGL